MPKGAKYGGRQKGSQNLITKDIRLAFKNLVENNTDNMIEWLDRIAITDPDKAIRIVMDMAEYNIPKLARTEIVEEKTIKFKVTVKK